MGKKNVEPLLEEATEQAPVVNAASLEDLGSDEELEIAPVEGEVQEVTDEEAEEESTEDDIEVVAADRFNEIKVISSEAVELTPEDARQFLQKYAYEAQRDVRRQNVQGLQYQMLRGRFLPGTQIKVVHNEETGEDVVINGNHRLTGLSELGEGIVVPFILTRMSAPTAREVGLLYSLEDGQFVRRPIDSLAPLGILKDSGLSKNFLTRVNAAVSIITTGFVGHGDKVFAIAQRTQYVRDRALTDWLPEAKAYDKLIEAASPKLRVLLENGEIMAVALVTLRNQPDKANEFWSTIAANDVITGKDPRKILVDYLLEGKAGSFDIVRKKRIKAQFSAGAWNAFFVGKEQVNKIKPAGMPILIEGTQEYNGVDTNILDYEDIKVDLPPDPNAPEPKEPKAPKPPKEPKAPRAKKGEVAAADGEAPVKKTLKKLKG